MQMKNAEHIRDFLDLFVDWASAQEDVEETALVGSYTRGEARDDSDIDLVLLTKEMGRYLKNIKRTERFGAVEKYQIEDYGKLFSIRVWYESGVEVEYGITTQAPPKQTLALVQPGIQSDFFIKTKFLSKIFIEKCMTFCPYCIEGRLPGVDKI
jgi:predicted nucleotidyltransferase